MAHNIQRCGSTPAALASNSFVGCSTFAKDTVRFMEKWQKCLVFPKDQNDPSGLQATGRSTTGRGSESAGVANTRFVMVTCGGTMTVAPGYRFRVVTVRAVGSRLKSTVPWAFRVVTVPLMLGYTVP